MDIEPSNKINYCSLGIGAIGIIIAALTAMKVIPHDVAKYCAVVIGLAFFSTFGITSTSMYTVVSEYIGNDEYIDITPFDDTELTNLLRMKIMLKRLIKPVTEMK